MLIAHQEKPVSLHRSDIFCNGAESAVFLRIRKRLKFDHYHWGVPPLTGLMKILFALGLLHYEIIFDLILFRCLRNIPISIRERKLAGSKPSARIIPSFLPVLSYCYRESGHMPDFEGVIYFWN
jgi:hypothetical protein